MQPMILGNMNQTLNATSHEEHVAIGESILDGIFAQELELA
jgi:hypothetical protein